VITPGLTHLETVMQLSDRSRPLIEATLRVVGEHINEIAEHFYRHMFAGHPELLDGTFNRGNQAQGTQQEALAGSVAAYASALVNTPDHLPEILLARWRTLSRAVSCPSRPPAGQQPADFTRAWVNDRSQVLAAS
jgi:hypothetical protein